MKKITSYLVISISIFVFWSCNKKDGFGNINSQALKTQVFIDTIRGLEKVGSILRFETTDDYVEFIEDTSQVKWDKLADFSSEKGFVNYFQQSPVITNSDSSLMDEDFGQLLNVDGVLIIGDKAIKIDKPNESVYITSMQNLNLNYQDLIIGDTLNKSIIQFSTSDDVIDYLYLGFIEKCGGSEDIDATSNKLYRFEDDTTDYVDYYARYNKLGIYYSVKIRAIHHIQLSALQNYSNVKFKLKLDDLNDSHSMRFRPRPCSGSNNVYHHGGTRSFQKVYPFNGNMVLKFVAYERVRSLNGYRLWMKGIFYGAANNNIETSEWIGDEVNSNF
jgi:hypothetical protein